MKASQAYKLSAAVRDEQQAIYAAAEEARRVSKAKALTESLRARIAEATKKGCFSAHVDLHYADADTDLLGYSFYPNRSSDKNIADRVERTMRADGYRVHIALRNQDEDGQYLRIEAMWDKDD